MRGGGNTNDSKKLGLLFYTYSVGLALILFVSNICCQFFLGYDLKIESSAVG